MGAILQNVHGCEVQIENSNTQNNIKIITLLALSQKVFKVNINFKKSRFPLTLMLMSLKK